MSAPNANTDQHNFLAALAQGCPEGLRFIVAEKHDYLDKQTGDARQSFPSEAWREQYLDGPWYFCTGATDRAGSRKRENLKALRAIVIDDVGTKVDREKLLAAPTWEMETSPGNFQLGYMLKEWSADIQGGDELFQGLVDAGLQDPGVRTCCRLFRLPDSVNDKPGRDNFRSVLHSFDANIVYTLKSLAKALKVTPGKVERPRPAVVPIEIDPAEHPDAIYDWLVDHGMVRYEMGDGWWQIDCPWESEHTNGNPGTRYRPRWAAPDGCSGVMCYHAHGQDGSAYRRRFIEWLAANEAPPWPAPIGRSMDAFQETLRKMLPPPAPPVTPQAAHDEPEPGDQYTYASLRAALGTIEPSALPHWETTADGHAKQVQPTSYENVEKGLAFLGVQPRLNLMTAKVSFILPERIDPARFGNKDEHQIADMVDAALTDVFGRCRMKNETKLRACIERMANTTFWHPMRDWVLSRPWDGKDRFESLAATMPTPTPDLFRVYFRRWCLQTIEASCGWVKRMKSQKGMVLILVGPQRIGKTRWLMSLAPGFGKMGRHLNLNGSNARDSKHEALQGAIVELGEFDGTLTKTDTAALKAFMTEETDEYRLPYAQTWLRRPRCTSFCGSVNEYKFLTDPTGSGRFLPIEVDGRPQVDHAIDVQQFWAQMYTEWDAGAPWWLSDAEAARRDAVAGQFQATDVAAEAFEETLDARKDEEAFPIAAVVGPGTLCELCELDPMVKANAACAGRVLRDVLGKGRDLRHRGAVSGQPRWIVNVTDQEMRRHKLRVAKPGAKRA